MTTYYVGPGGNNANPGTSWAQRKLTLNGAEDIPVAAGDTVYVGPGTYRELLTIDVSGSIGSPIAYIGDYSGANTSGTKGVVRISGSDADTSAVRANCIAATSKDYRTFQGFLMDGCTSHLINLATACSNWIVELSSLFALGQTISSAGTGTNNVFRRCYLVGTTGSTANVLFTHTSVVDNTANLVENCVILGGVDGVRSVRVGGVTVRNCLILYQSSSGVSVTTALNSGQVMTVNNCIIGFCGTALRATTTAEFVENYNSISSVSSARSNVSVGANSNTYLYLPDVRWLFESILASGTLASPFDHASYSALVELNSGTGAPSTDMRGAAAMGTYREWGPLEYNSALAIAASVGAGGLLVHPGMAGGMRG